MPTLTINSKQVTVDEGATVLKAAEKAGIHIPTLCSHKALSPYGACRICLVEIKAKGGSTIQTACTYPALDGLVVETDTERVKKNRRIMIELLLARCPDSMEVKNLAEEYGVKEIRLRSKNEDCTLCGLCVRMCEERMGIGALNFAGRGPTREVTSPFGEPGDICQVCGACDFVCPTGKIKIPEMTGKKPIPILSEYNAGLVQRPAIYIPYPQAIPNKATIDARYCVHMLKGECEICKELCEAEAVDYEQKEETIDIDIGAVVLSPGYDMFDASKKFEYGYLKYPDVVTAIEFERILSASGPFKGHILRPSDHKPPKKIAFIQCVGSRDNKHDYCSSVCCMFAIKEAIIAKEHDHNIESTIYYMDIRSYGKEFERYFERAKNEYGVDFVHSRVSDITGNSRDGLTVKFEDPHGHLKQQHFDLVVLSAGFEGFGRLSELGEKLGMPLNRYGYIASDAINTVETKAPGLFICGPAQEPKDIPDTVIQASAAASAVMEILSDSRWEEITEKTYPVERDVSSEPVKIGVFICHCGINIGGIVDVPSVVEYAKTLPNVEYAEENIYTCSQDTQDHMKEMIKEHGLNRIIVASCTPRTHEPLFQETIREAGLNKHLFAMANIRDQCSWIHKDMPEQATKKSRDLIRMAVAKISLVEPLPRIPLKVTQRALVIGGGPAGMSTALSLARQGFPVDLIEKESVLGGNLRKLVSTLEGKRIKRILEEMLLEIEKNSLISIHCNAEVKGVEGFIGNYKTKIQEKGSSEGSEIVHGATIIATGAVESTPAEYLYGKDERVKTGLEFESYCDTCNDDGLPQSTVFIQCVGSREDPHMYCSKICCRQTIKNALALKGRNPNAEVYVLYRDIRTYGFSEHYYRKARDAGIVFIRFELEDKPEVLLKDKRLFVKVRETMAESIITISADMVVLAARIDPAPGNEIMSQHFKVPLTADKFFLEAHVKLRPVDFATEGIFLAGMAHSPKTIAESVAQGRAAAARAATIISRDTYEAEATIAAVNEEICDGCAVCVGVCEFNAIEIVELEDEKKIVRLNEAMCKGCGGCVAACPSGAMEQKGFKNDQILAEIDAALQ
jgi:heterodisulfide reductase subunit A